MSANKNNWNRLNVGKRCSVSTDLNQARNCSFLRSRILRAKENSLVAETKGGRILFVFSDVSDNYGPSRNFENDQNDLSSGSAHTTTKIYVLFLCGNPLYQILLTKNINIWILMYTFS